MKKLLKTIFKSRLDFLFVVLDFLSLCLIVLRICKVINVPWTTVWAPEAIRIVVYALYSTGEVMKLHKKSYKEEATNTSSNEQSKDNTQSGQGVV